MLWQDFELSRKSIQREESKAEKALKARIADLEARVVAGEGEADFEPEEGDDVQGGTVAEAVQVLEQQLVKLTTSLDDKVRRETASTTPPRPGSRCGSARAGVVAVWWPLWQHCGSEARGGVACGSDVDGGWLSGAIRAGERGQV